MTAQRMRCLHDRVFEIILAMVMGIMRLRILVVMYDHGNGPSLRTVLEVLVGSVSRSPRNIFAPSAMFGVRC
jgi:hypothetical protein